MRRQLHKIEMLPLFRLVLLPATGNQWGTTVHKAENRKDSLQTNFIDIDAGCLNVWGLQLLAGRNFPAIPGGTTDHEVMINETMLHHFKYGTAQQAIGQHIIVDNNDAEIVGVVKDFQFLDVSSAMQPLMLRNRKKRIWLCNRSYKWQ